MQCGLTPQRDFGTIHPIDTRLSARCAAGGNYGVAGEEAELHQAPCDVLWKIQPVQDPGFAGLQMGQRLRSGWVIPPGSVLVDTQLHHEIGGKPRALPYDDYTRPFWS